MLPTMTFKEFRREFGATVKGLREARKWTQPQLADAIEVLDQGGLSRVERGLQGFTAESLFRIAQALDTPVYRLFGGADPKQDMPSPEAMDYARQYDKLTSNGRVRFQAAMILAMEAAPNERVEQAGYTKQGYKRP